MAIGTWSLTNIAPDRKWEAYCVGCDMVLGYLLEKPAPHSPMLAKDVMLPNGKMAKAGDRINCDCRVGCSCSSPNGHNYKVRSREIK